MNDTIASIATAHGISAIGIIRITGDNAFNIAEKIFIGKRKFSEIKSHNVSYGKIRDKDKNIILDEVIILKMMKPNTFTKEDVVEINCHGGISVQKTILELVLKNGARLSDPGEFTKRAFLNGRIDLAQAESIIDVINSKTEEAQKAAIDQLDGKLSRTLKAARAKLIELLAHIAVTVDYPEHDIEEITAIKAIEDIVQVRIKLIKISESFNKGRLIRDGLNLVIAGKPNVGKSSLLNELSGKNRAIVTDIPGTTRDILDEYINIKGIPVRIIDTAGIRNTSDFIEKIGIEKTEKTIESADLVLLMIDAIKGIDEEDFRILEKVNNKKHIIIINKVDAVEPSKLALLEDKIKDKKVLKISAKQSIGIDDLENYISEEFLSGNISSNSEILLTNIRHKNLIDNAISCIDDAINAHECGMPIDVMSIDFNNAADFLGQITGESVSEEVVHEIFKRFCIGK